METHKLVLVGDGGVGKSTLLKKIQKGDFDPRYIATLGVEVEPLRLDNRILNVWDCAGQERFQGLQDGYFIHGDGLIVCFDITSRVSFRNVPGWIQKYLKVPNAKQNVVICGLKADLERKVTLNEIEELIEKIKVPYVEVSSKEDRNLTLPFLEMCKYF